MANNQQRHALVGPADLWQMKREFQITYLRNSGLQPEHYLFDIGCGTLRGGVPLIQHLDAGRYFGLEIRADVLAEGLLEIKENALDAKRPCLIYGGDLAALRLATRFDFIWAFSVLIHLSDEILDDCLGFVSAQLAPAGSFHANVNVGARREWRWMGFPVTRRPMEFYQSRAEKSGLTVADVGALGELGHISGDPAGDAQRMLRFSKAD